MKKEPLKTKKVTIDDLAKLIVDGRKETHDLAGVVDSLAIMVANGFERVEDRLGKVETRLENVENRLENVEENLGTTRQDVLSLGDRFVPRYEFHDLLVRFDKLE